MNKLNVLWIAVIFSVATVIAFASTQVTLADCKQGKAFSGINELVISEGIGQIEIETHSDHKAEVSYFGADADLAEKIVVFFRDKKLTISLKESHQFKDGKLYFKKERNKLYDVSDLHIKIKIPLNTQLKCNLEVGNLNIKGPLKEKAQLSISGIGNISIEEIDNKLTEVSINGAGNFICKRLNALSFIGGIQGTGSVEVQEGKISSGESTIRGSGTIDLGKTDVKLLKAMITGTGSIQHDGIIQDFIANIYGAGNINVRKVTGHIEKSLNGVGAINIG